MCIILGRVRKYRVRWTVECEVHCWPVYWSGCGLADRRNRLWTEDCILWDYGLVNRWARLWTRGTMDWWTSGLDCGLKKSCRMDWGLLTMDRLVDRTVDFLSMYCWTADWWTGGLDCESGDYVKWSPSSLSVSYNNRWYHTFQTEKSVIYSGIWSYLRYVLLVSNQRL